MGPNVCYEKTQAGLIQALNSSGLPLCCVRDILERLYLDAQRQMQAAVAAEAKTGEAAQDAGKEAADG